MPIDIVELEFDDDNVSEIEAHNVTLEQVQSVLNRTPKFFRNTRGRAGTHLMVGPDDGGIFLSIPIIKTPVPGRWRPVTAWRSSTGHITRWRQAK